MRLCFTLCGSASIRVIGVWLDGWEETGRCGMMRKAKWALGSGLQVLCSECRDGCWTVSAVKPDPDHTN